jgi:hypothetical protein
MMAKKNRILIALASMMGVSLAVSAFVFAASGGVGGRPANPDPDNPRTQSIFIYTLESGKTKSDQLYLSNGGDTDQVVQLYAVDGTVSNTGAFTCKQAVEARTDMGKAIQLSKNEVTVPANGNLLVDFTVTVPAKSDVGEHDGCIVIQKKEDTPQQQTGSIQVHTRTAVRVVVIVPGDVHREIGIANFTAVSSYMKGSKTYIGPQVSFDLKNEGNVSADVAVTVHVRDIFGNEMAVPGSSSQKAFFSGQYPVIADSTFTVNYDAEDQPFFGGWYKVKADIAYNKKAGTFGVDAAAADIVRVQSKEITIFFWPSLWFFVILGLLVLSALSFVGWRFVQSRDAKKRARDSLKRPSEKTMWGPYEIQEGDTIEQLAAKSGVAIGKIAVMNKLDTPYTLEPGQKIYLPRKR